MPRKLYLRPLSIPEILRWADAYRELTGKWPIKTSGTILANKFESWSRVDNALRNGLRNLPHGGSLAQLLSEHRGVRNKRRLQPLSEEQILAWADLHYERTRTWPTAKSGTVLGSQAEQWSAVSAALQVGGRGLPGGTSLAQLLAKHRGVRNRKALPPFSEEQILGWADAHFQRTGLWPNIHTGPIIESPGETWLAVDAALRSGIRGLPGKSSLAFLLADRRHVRNILSLPVLSIPQILSWVDNYHARTGEWPQWNSGTITEAPSETWCAINQALRKGYRGLPGGFSLAELLAVERDIRNWTNVPKLTRKQILTWADAHRRRTGKWPTSQSGSIPEAPDDTWAAIDGALKAGNRGLRPGSSLARLLAATGRKKLLHERPLSRKKVLVWADAHFARTGSWPTRNSGPVVDAPQEKWSAIDMALKHGCRRLGGRSSLAKLLAQKRGVRNLSALPDLREEAILSWAQAFYQRAGKWPIKTSGPIPEAPGETWSIVNRALAKGERGLAGESSLVRLLAKLRAATADTSLRTADAGVTTNLR